MAELVQKTILPRNRAFSILLLAFMTITFLFDPQGALKLAVLCLVILALFEFYQAFRHTYLE